MSTYSFLDTICTLVGPGGSLNLGAGAAAAEEGITISPSGAINTMTIGADGQGMHSLHGDKSGTITVRLLKTSPMNAALSALYALQTSNAAMHGKNTLVVTNLNLRDLVSCRGVAFQKAPELVYAKAGNINEWVFDAIFIDRDLGAGGAI